jgi:penicillin-binding protein 2
MIERRYQLSYRVVSLGILILLFSNVVLGAQHARRRRSGRRSTHRAASVRPAYVQRRAATSARFVRASYVRPRTGLAAPVVRGGPWTEPTYADSTQGDNVDGEDLAVRRAAVDALGSYNGSVVVVDPSNGRILTMVNQKLALGSGFQPCSTIKVSVALAALSEKLIPTAPLHLRRPGGMNLTYALARSNNAYFAGLGVKLGFERVSRYAHLFGYGEKAGLDIAGEQPGRFPAVPPKNGGVGMLTSFGEEISQTPLQLAALMSALANGGTLYYMQYPRTPQQIAAFMPRVKRRLEIQEIIPQVKPGMLGAVQFGTARRAQQEETIAGKTGTCTDTHTHLGWFGSFNESGPRKLVVVVLMTGGRPAIGPMAAGIAGQVYKNLGQPDASPKTASVTPAELISTQICCAR